MAYNTTTYGEIPALPAILNHPHGSGKIYDLAVSRCRYFLLREPPLTPAIRSHPLAPLEGFRSGLPRPSSPPTLARDVLLKHHVIVHHVIRMTCANLRRGTVPTDGDLNLWSLKKVLNASDVQYCTLICICIQCSGAVRCFFKAVLLRARNL